MLNIFSQLSDMTLEGFSSNPNKKYENGLFANGIWQRRKEPVGTFTIQMEKVDGKKYGLTTDCQFSFVSALPKMPYTIFESILEFYREVYKLYKSEVYVSVYWNKLKKDYFLYVPVQQVGGATVKFENDETMLNNPDYFIVMDSHSH